MGEKLQYIAACDIYINIKYLAIIILYLFSLEQFQEGGEGKVCTLLFLFRFSFITQFRNKQWRNRAD